MYLKVMSGHVKIGQFMLGSIQSVHVKDLSLENMASSSLQYGLVSLAQLPSPSGALLAKLVNQYFAEENVFQNYTSYLTNQRHKSQNEND